MLETPQGLQKQINALFKLCVERQLVINVSKTKVVVFEKRRNATPDDALPSHGVKPTWGFHKVELWKVETWRHAPGFQL